MILRAPAGKRSALVACYIGAADWFTASTSFANPAAVLGRMLSDSFAGIAPASAPGFVLAQCLGAAAGWGLATLLGRSGRDQATRASRRASSSCHRVAIAASSGAPTLRAVEITRTKGRQR